MNISTLNGSKWMNTSFLKRYYGQTLEVTEDVADRNQDGLTDWRKTQGNWVVEIGARILRIEDDGENLIEEAKARPGL